MSEIINLINPLLYSQSQLRREPVESWGGNFTQNTQWPYYDYWRRLSTLEQYIFLQSLARITQISLHCKAVLRRMQEQSPNKNQPWEDRLARPKVRERILGHKIAKRRENPKQKRIINLLN